MYKQTMGIGEVGGWAIVEMWGGDWGLGRCVERAGVMISHFSFIFIPIILIPLCSTPLHSTPDT